MSDISLHLGTVEDWAASYDGEPYMALICDPPYHLGKQGFMNKAWDRGGPDAVAFRPETWAALGAHLLPGAFGMAFASSRGWHRLACAIEDAGFIIHPSIFLYLYGSGFPKATRIPDDRFSGHRYGLQCLKPAAEPLICFQKPYQGKPVECITRTGAGSLWVDGGRVAGPSAHDAPATANNIYGGHEETIPSELRPRYTMPSAGRWPANFAICHLPGCKRVGSKRVRPKDGFHGNPRHVEADGYITWAHKPEGYSTTGYTDPDGTEQVDAWECEPGCPVAALDAQAGERRSAGMYPSLSVGTGNGTTYLPTKPQGQLYADTGGPSRFFHVSDWSYEVAEQLDAADPCRYVAKASRGERDAGLVGFPLGEPPASARSKPAEGRQNALGEPRANHHPCCKPIALTRWLATLLLPPAAYAPRRILIPFAGSGSEMIGAALAGWEEIQGVEMNAEYVEIARARLAYWLKRPEQLPLALAGG